MTKVAAMRTLSVAAVMLAALTSPRSANASLIGYNATVTFVEPGNPDAVNVVTAGAGPEITPADGTDIGDNILLDGEFIDFGDFSIVYRVRGDGADLSGHPGYQTTGFDPDATYVFSGLTFGPTPYRITGVNVGLANVILVALGSEVTFTDDSVSLRIGTLGVGQVAGGPDLGTITLDLQVEPVGGTPVPEPSVFAMLGLGLAAASWHRWRG
jgi:hypothetical protein